MAPPPCLRSATSKVALSSRDGRASELRGQGTAEGGVRMPSHQGSLAAGARQISWTQAPSGASAPVIRNLYAVGLLWCRPSTVVTAAAGLWRNPVPMHAPWPPLTIAAASALPRSIC